MLVDVERWEWDYSITPHIYYGYMFRRYSFNCWWEKVLNAACIINAYGVYRNPTKMRYYCSKRVFCWQASIRDKIVETLYSNRVTTANKRIHTPPLHSKVECSAWESDGKSKHSFSNAVHCIQYHSKVSYQSHLVSCAMSIAYHENHWSRNFWCKLLMTHPARNQLNTIFYRL